MAASRRGKKKKSEGRLGVIGICAVVVVFGILMFSRIEASKDEKAGLYKAEQQLQEQLKAEEDKSKELEERKIYVKTKMYIEEMAKKLGLVYPDELIYRPSED